MVTDQKYSRKDAELTIKTKKVEATRLFRSTGSHKQVAAQMRVSLRKAYELVDDGLDAELNALRGVDGADISALQAHEYLKIKNGLQAMIRNFGGYETVDPKMAKEVRSIVKELRQTLEAIDRHYAATGKFVKKEEINHIVNYKEDPQVQNLLVAVCDFLERKEIAPAELFEYIDDSLDDERMERDGPLSAAVDAQFEDLPDIEDVIEDMQDDDEERTPDRYCGDCGEPIYEEDEHVCG